MTYFHGSLFRALKMRSLDGTTNLVSWMVKSRSI